MPEITPRRLFDPAAVPFEDIPLALAELRQLEARLLQRLLAQPTASPPSEELLTVEQAAEKLKVSADFLYRNWKRLPFARRFDFGVRFVANELDRFIREATR